MNRSNNAEELWEKTENEVGWEISVKQNLKLAHRAVNVRNYQAAISAVREALAYLTVLGADNPPLHEPNAERRQTVAELREARAIRRATAGNPRYRPNDHR